MTWEEMATAEPELVKLLHRGCAAAASADYCKSRVWYGRGGLKADMTKLVGHLSIHGADDLGSATSYEDAYRTLFDLLPMCPPDCNCGAGDSAEARQQLEDWHREQETA